MAAHRGGPVIPDDRRRRRRVVGPRSRLPYRVAVPLVLTSIEFRGERLVADGGAPLFIPRDERLHTLAREGGESAEVLAEYVQEVSEAAADHFSQEPKQPREFGERKRTNKKKLESAKVGK